ncbi:MAG: ribulose-phosphate 3-epimerase [Bacteroidales bacterium]|jgi:ribulose-phosphate 3-epimerase|nr:ribulose-phosphate 3-epimerase [Bacteroidales bacterium]
MSHLVAPSLLSANFLNLGEDIEMLNRSEADWIHLDIMDGVFVPNISFGFPVIEKIALKARKPLDVHLMIIDPDRYIDRFRENKAEIITVHSETCPHLHRTIDFIKKSGAKAGVALNPHSPVALLTNIIRDLDLVLLMSVNPGFGGQKFIGETYEKILELEELIARKNTKTLVEVDGGVDLTNASRLIENGANVLVTGNAVFTSPSPIETIHRLKNLQ